MKYRKKPVVIDATQWKRMGDHLNVSPYTDVVMLPNAPDEYPELCPECGQPYGEHGLVSTLEDTHAIAHRVCPGDWIITGIKGEHYACKPDIFAASYEEVKP